MDVEKKIAGVKASLHYAMGCLHLRDIEDAVRSLNEALDRVDALEKSIAPKEDSK